MSRIATIPLSHAALQPLRVVIGVDPAVPNGDQCIVELWSVVPTLIADVAYGTHVGAASRAVVDEAETVIDATAEVVED